MAGGLEKAIALHGAGWISDVDVGEMVGLSLGRVRRLIAKRIRTHELALVPNREVLPLRGDAVVRGEASDGYVLSPHAAAIFVMDLDTPAAREIQRAITDVVIQEMKKPVPEPGTEKAVGKLRDLLRSMGFPS